MTENRLLLFGVALGVAVGLLGCDSDPLDDGGDPVAELQMYADLPADPTTGFDEEGRPLEAGRFTFFSLRENEIVPVADSASTMWDLAFKSTTILTNGGASGPGNGGAVVLEEAFEDVMEAPAEDQFSVDAPESPAIPTGSGNGWYNYNPQQNLITPIPGRVLVVRTADGRYAKVRILSYYRGNPADVDPLTDESRYYTLEYVFQPDGSRSFDTGE